MIFYKKLNLQQIYINELYLKQVEIMRKINFFFLGKKYENIINLKFFQLLNSMNGISLKRFVYFFTTELEYSFLYFSIVINVEKIFNLQQILRNLLLNYELNKIILKNCKYKQINGLYQGERLKLNLPNRGQRTKTNAGTVKQKRQSSKLSGLVKNVNRKRKK